MTAARHAVRGAILDVDGTLVDSNDQHARAWVAALRESGFDIRYEQVRPLIGMGGDRLIPRLTGLDDESPIGSRVRERREEIFRAQYLPHLESFAEVRALLQRMRDAGLVLAVASSAQPKDLERLLQLTGADALIQSSTSAADAGRSKPDPDVIHAALRRTGLGPDEVLMLGDTPYDVESAGSAGIRTVAVRCGGWRDDALCGALAIYDDPAALLASFDESPYASGIPSAELAS